MSSFEELKKESEEMERVKEKWIVHKAENLESLDIPESEFVIDRLIPKAGITVIAGNPSSGKSWITLEIAKIIGSGYSFLGEFSAKEKTKVLYIDEENNISEIKRRWCKLESQDINLKAIADIDFMSLAGFKIDSEAHRKELEDKINFQDYKVIIFDSLVDLHSKNENSSQEMQALIDLFRGFCRKGITMVLIHHQRKENFLSSREGGQMLRGSSALQGGIDSLVCVNNTKKTDNLLEFLISQPKLRQGKPNSPFKIKLEEIDEKMKFEFMENVEDEDRKTMRVKDELLGILEQEMKRKDIVSLLGTKFSGRTILRALKELKEEGKVESRKEGKEVVYSSF